MMSIEFIFYYAIFVGTWAHFIENEQVESPKCWKSVGNTLAISIMEEITFVILKVGNVCLLEGEMP